MRKMCLKHGTEDVLLSTDTEFWKSANAGIQAAHSVNTSLQTKPYMIIIEALDECDIACPTCIASSVPGSGNFRTRADLNKRVSSYVAQHGRIPLLMISGGEPALHPEIVAILQDMQLLAEQVMLITNGIRISRDEAFVAELSQIRPGFQVYLQFDSLQANALILLRGKDYTSVRLGALRNLEKYQIATTLVSVVKRGVNDTEVADIVRTAARYSNVMGVTFQPIRSSGRHLDFRYEEHSISLSEVRKTILSTYSWPEHSILPHPVNPEGICIGYFDNSSEALCPITSELFTDRAAFFEQADHESQSNGLYLSQRELEARYPGKCILRITIISFLDKHDYTVESSKRRGIYFLDDAGSLITLDNRFLFGLNAHSESNSTPNPK